LLVDVIESKIIILRIVTPVFEIKGDQTKRKYNNVKYKYSQKRFG